MEKANLPAINSGAMTAGASDESTVIYRTRAIQVVGVCLGLYLISGVVVASKGRYPVIALVVAGALGLPLQLLELRRKIAVSPIGFEYKWRSGRIFKMAWADVARIEETTTTYAISMRPIEVRAIRIVPRSGEAVILPLDFPKWQEILQRFQDMVSSNKAGTPA